VVNFITSSRRKCREHMAELGFRTINEMVGRSDRIEMRRTAEHLKRRARHSAILYQPKAGPRSDVMPNPAESRFGKNALDTSAVDLASPALERREKVKAKLDIRNTNRVVGTILGSEVTRRSVHKACPKIRFIFTSRARRASFAAFIPPGVTLSSKATPRLFRQELSGGKVILYPPEIDFRAGRNIIVVMLHLRRDQRRGVCSRYGGRTVLRA